MADSTSLLRDLALVLVIASAMTLLMQRLRLPVHVGYLIAGIVIGPGLPLHLVMGHERIETLAELGVILLLFSIGLEFSIRKLLHQGPRVLVAAAIETAALFTVGVLVARGFGWRLTEGIFLGAAIAVASTMMLSRSLADHPPDRRLRDLTLGINVVEDLVAMFMIAALSALVAGQQVTGLLLARTLFWLGVFVVSVVGFGLMIIPGLIRAVVRTGRMELLLITSLSLCFLLSWLAYAAGHSVALGAFIAGFLVNESGAGREIREIVRPLRYLFGAIFFVSIGMLVQPAAVREVWPAILAISAVVILGNTLFVALGSFVAGFGVSTSVRAGFYMSQVGEFGFIIAAMAAAAGSPQIFPVVVGTSILTATSANVLVGRSQSVANWIDRKLPHAWQTYASLYSSWIEALDHRPRREGQRSEARRLVRLVALDAGLLAAVVVVTALMPVRAAELLGGRVAPGAANLVIVLVGASLAVVLLAGVFSTGRRLATVLAERAIPAVEPGKVDPGLAPRRVLRATLVLVIVLAALLPVVLISLPFVPVYGGPSLLVAIGAVLLVSLWRATRDLAGHARAGAELVVHVLGRQGMAQETGMYERVEQMLPGLGSVRPVRIEPGTNAVGKTLGELNLRGRTGATIVGISRTGADLPYPTARERLQAGDLVALTGSRDAVQAASRELESRPEK